MISKKGIELIKKFECFVPLEYVCIAGKRTIGYGHVLQKHESYPAGVTEEQAVALLGGDVDTAEKAVASLVKVFLTQSQYDALVSFVFNVGADNFRRSTLLKELNAGNFDEAVNQFEKWIYVNLKPVRGLRRRRKEEAALFEKSKNERGRPASFFYEKEKKDA